jgi:hypothetical protein
VLFYSLLLAGKMSVCHVFVLFYDLIFYINYVISAVVSTRYRIVEETG